MATARPLTGKKSSVRQQRTKPRPAPTENVPPELPQAPLSIPQIRMHTGGAVQSSRLFDDTPLTIAFRHIKPSWRNYIEYVDMAARNGDEDMARYVKVWLGLTPKDRRNHAPEQLCELSNVKPDELIGAVCSAIWRAKSAEGSLVSAMAHPAILERTAKAAAKAAGYKDRELFFRVTGNLPDKKGTSVIINNSPQTLVTGGPLPVGRQPGGLPSMDEEAVDMSRLLEAAPVDAEVEAEDV